MGKAVLKTKNAVKWLKEFGWSSDEITKILNEGRRLPIRELTWFKLWVYKGLSGLHLSVGEARKLCKLSKKALTEYRWILREPDDIDVIKRLMGC